MQGTVTLFMQDKGFGFARPDDGGEEVWLHIGSLVEKADKPKLVKNARVSFDLDKPPEEGKKRKALNIRILDASEPTAPPPPTPATTAAASSPHSTAPPPHKTAKYDPDIISITFREVKLTGFNLLVTVWANDTSLRLRAYLEDNPEVKQEGFVNPEGLTDFCLKLRNQQRKQAVLQICVAVVTDSNEVPVPWRYNWINLETGIPKVGKGKAEGATPEVETGTSTPPEPAPAAEDVLEPIPTYEEAPAAPEPPPPPTAPPQLDVKLRCRQGQVYTFRIKTAPQRSVAVESVCLISACVSGVPDWRQGRGKQLQFDADESGNLELEVQLVTAGDRGIVEFSANGLAHQEYLKNDEPATPAAKETL